MFVVKTVILCDFDGTISTMDVADTIFTVYLGDRWDEIDREWHDGGISMVELYNKCWQLVDASEEELADFVDRISIDSYFADFVRAVDRERIPIFLVSDGFDFYIDRIMNRHGLSDLKHYSNKLFFENGKVITEFNNQNYECTQCANCKKFVIDEKRGRSDFVIYIGNGLSDRCAAEHADLVFAKDSLREHCEKNRIGHVSYNSFDDLIKYLIMNDFIKTDGVNAADTNGDDVEG
jgi:2-hydroxy-3-keto-5-methylthiopentenyl-1-phosphate phosphatase